MLGNWKPRALEVIPRLRRTVKLLGTVGERDWLCDLPGHADNGYMQLRSVFFVNVIRLVRVAGATKRKQKE
jgi:hypothetical protein